MQITTPAFVMNGSIPQKYTCDGAGHNPPLTFSQLPPATLSLVLLLEDPDAPGNIFTHWILYNISPQTTTIEENQIPSGALEGRNSTGKTGFIPPCPPSNIHRYIFRLFALDTMLDLPEGSTREEIEEAMKTHILETTTTVGLYGKN